jgi:hypothetical protein
MNHVSSSLFTIALTVLCGCTGSLSHGGPGQDGQGPGQTPGSGPQGNAGSAGGGNPDVCTPGVPATSQIPRLLNREYDAVIKDLVGVTNLASAGNGVPSTLLVPDFDGSLTDIAWNSYLEAAKSIAAEVMTGSGRGNFISCDPSAAACLTDTIRNFGRKAFRRPLTDAEVARFEVLNNLTPKGTGDEVAEAILFALLASPSFITLPELAQDADGAAFKLSAHEVATRLSLLLWGSIPDQILNTAADAGQLATKEQILEQATRMIQVREKTAPAVVGFHRQYADIREGSHWGTLDHDATKYPAYSPAAVAPMMAEIDAFFEEVAFQSGSFKDLLLSNVAFVTKDTAALYGLDPATYGSSLTRVELDATQRPGFLTRAGFLSSYSSFAATSPILRGAFITTKVLGVDPGAPDPNAINTPIPPGTYTTQREAIEALTSPANCKACHATYVNPPGFVLERYDAVGRWQDTDPLGGPISGSADVYFAEGNVKTITTPLELMTAIGTGVEAKKHYAKRFVSYGFGRAPNSNDACVVEQLGQKLSQDGYTILNLLTDLTQADAFRLRTKGT